MEDRNKPKFNPDGARQAMKWAEYRRKGLIISLTGATDPTDIYRIQGRISETDALLEQVDPSKKPVQKEGA